MTAPVPEWVYMAEVPPPTERTTCPGCGLAMRGRGTLEHDGEGVHWYAREPAPRRRSGTVAAACILAAFLVIVLAVVTR